MELKLGISSYAYYWAIKRTSSQAVDCESVCSLIEQVSTKGLEVFQICENMPLHHLDKNDLNTIAKAAQQKGITLELGARGLDVNHLMKYLEISKIFHSKILRIVPWSGSEVQRLLPIDELSRVIKELLPICWKEGISLAIENYFDLPDENLLFFLDEIQDERVGVCLDTANSTGFLQDPVKTAELLAKYTISLHLKDFVVTKPVMGYRISGVPLGQGWLDAPAVIRKIIQSGRCPNALIELWIDQEENQEATIKKEEIWVNQSINYARETLGFA